MSDAQCTGPHQSHLGCPVHDPRYGTEAVRKGEMAAALFSRLVERELERATSRNGPMRGPHEAYGVIKEEFDEWFDEIKRNAPSEALLELVQVAAMVHRAARDVYGLSLLEWAERFLTEKYKLQERTR